MQHKTNKHTNSQTRAQANKIDTDDMYITASLRRLLLSYVINAFGSQSLHNTEQDHILLLVSSRFAGMNTHATQRFTV